MKKKKMNPRLLIGFSDLIKQFYNNKSEELSTLNLKTVHCTFLHLLSDHEGITQQEMANIALIKRSTASELITEMAQEGLIERVGSVQDKRRIHVYLTELGKQKAALVRGYFDDYIATCTQSFTAEEISQFENLLEKFNFPK